MSAAWASSQVVGTDAAAVVSAEEEGGEVPIVYASLLEVIASRPSDMAAKTADGFFMVLVLLLFELPVRFLIKVF
jgi:hypothetical protein